jgi:hypothetical protein
MSICFFFMDINIDQGIITNVHRINDDIVQIYSVEYRDGSHGPAPEPKQETQSYKKKKRCAQQQISVGRKKIQILLFELGKAAADKNQYINEGTQHKSRIIEMGKSFDRKKIDRGQTVKDSKIPKHRNLLSKAFKKQYQP